MLARLVSWLPRALFIGAALVWLLPDRRIEHQLRERERTGGARAVSIDRVRNAPHQATLTLRKLERDRDRSSSPRALDHLATVGSAHTSIDERCAIARSFNRSLTSAIIREGPLQK